MKTLSLKPGIAGLSIFLRQGHTSFLDFRFSFSVFTKGGEVHRLPPNDK